MADEKKKITGKDVAIVAVLALVVFGFYQLGSSGSTDVPEPDGGVSKSDAWGACKDAVEEQLRNPATVDFELLAADISEQPDGGWSIAGSLTAENDFGVEQDIGYSCKVDANGHVTAKVA